MRRTFFRPERPTLTSRSLQSITRPFQKRFREVFGNARILIFYLSIKAWEEKFLPKSHLGWFFLVFGEGKTVHLTFKVAEHSFGSSCVYVICQIMARERLQLTSWNLAIEKYTDERFWLTAKMWRFCSFRGNMKDWIQP